jgi:hypothetical protein
MNRIPRNGKPSSLHPCNVGSTTLENHPIEGHGIDKASVSDRPHPSSIRSGIVFTDAFVVARRRHQAKVFAIRKQQNRHLRSGEFFFNDDLPRSFDTSRAAF